MIDELIDDSNKVKVVNQLDVLRLVRSQNIGIKTFFDLIKLYKTPQNALTQLSKLAQKGGAKKDIKICTIEEAEKELTQVRNYGAKIITIFDNNYPQLLKTIYDPPPVITILGDEQLLNKQIFAMVGSRNATANGCRIAYKFARELGAKNYVITSGLARGIDSAAHKGALHSGTIAVIAGGIDNIYPPENNQLYDEIREKGLIISELAFGTVPKSQNFPQRNRIISGIAAGVLVIEASIKSGSLITAKYALEQNKEIFAIPGFPLEPRCQGTNDLIKQGATLVTNIEDIVNQLDNLTSFPSNEMINIKENFIKDDSLELNEEDEIADARRIILEKLSYVPTSVEEIIVISNCSYSAVLTVLLELELAGRLLRYPGNKVSLIFEEKASNE